MANDSTSFSDLCAKAKALRVDTVVVIPEFGQIILAIITLILLILTILSYKKHKIALHPNLMLLFVNIIFLYAFHNIFNVIVQGRYQILLYFSSDPCDLLTPVWLSVVLRVPGYIYVRAFVFSHFALTTERARATIFARRYEKEGIRYPLFCIVIIWVLTAAETSYVVVQALQDPMYSQPLVQVSITSETNGTFQIYMNLVGLALVIVTAIMDYILIIANRKNRARLCQELGINIVENKISINGNETYELSHKSKEEIFKDYSEAERLRNSDYSLSRIYQIKENIDIMNFIWPLDVWYAVVYTLYLAGATYVRIIKSNITYAQYIGYYDALYMGLSMHSIVTLLLYLRFVKQNRSKVTGVISEPNDPTRTYFEQLSAQWNKFE